MGINNKDIEIFIQGSYANNTNVRAGSDVDVCVMLKDTFFSQYPNGLSREDYGFSPGTNNFADFRKDIYSVLLDKFGQKDIINGNKSIKIKSNSYRVDADVIPSFEYRNYYYNNSKNPNYFIQGIKFYSLQNEEIINYPKIHIENGKIKNINTNKEYKRLVRIFKRIRLQMIKDGVSVNSCITSFLIECLVWNVPDMIITNYSSWEETIKEAIIYLYNNIEKSEKKWEEVSRIFWLFHSQRKWNIPSVKFYLKQMWDYLNFR